MLVCTCTPVLWMYTCMSLILTQPRDCGSKLQSGGGGLLLTTNRRQLCQSLNSYQDVEETEAQGMNKSLSGWGFWWHDNIVIDCRTKEKIRQIPRVSSSPPPPTFPVVSLSHPLTASFLLVMLIYQLRILLEHAGSLLYANSLLALWQLCVYLGHSVRIQLLMLACRLWGEGCLWFQMEAGPLPLNIARFSVIWYEGPNLS